MRPTYETASDRAAEESAARLLCEPHGIVWHKLPRRYEVDYLLRRKGSLYGWLEVKVRPGVTRYATYMVSAQKVLTGSLLAERFGGRFLILVRDGDDLRVLDARAERPRIGFGGRQDRGDDQDMEPVAHYSWEQFKKLGG